MICQISGFADRLLHGGGVELAVGLRSWAADRRSLAAVEHAELDAAGIRDPTHQAVERVDFPDQMSFAKAADRRVAGHCPNGGKAVRDQGRPGAHPCGRGRGLTAGVPTAYDDDIELCVHGPGLRRASNGASAAGQNRRELSRELGPCFT